MAKILCGIATITPDKRFIETLPSFFKNVGRNHDIDCAWVWDKPLVDAQNELAEKVIDGNYDYLLTIEDDHWGFTSEMLDSCINADTHVCGIPYRSRHMPFDMIPMRYSGTEDTHGRKLYKAIHADSGYHASDLIGFGFTLIRSDVFRILDRPFFRLNCEKFTSVGPRATDIDFCVRLIEKGIQPIGCFDHLLQHRDIDEQIYQAMRLRGIMEKHSLFGMLRKSHEAQLKRRNNNA